MPSFTTIYRAFVMIAAGAIAVKGWQLYGPTTEQVKSFGVRAVEVAQTAWTNLQPNEPEPTAPPDDPRLAAASVAAPAPATVAEPAPLFVTAQDSLEPIAAEVATEDPVPASPAGADGLPLLYSRLEELGASDPQLGPWGSSGQLYRFCCRAALGDTPTFARHFEAVADEPVAAVKQVVAKVEAWRSVQGDGAVLP